MRLLFVSHSFPPPGRPLANVGGMQRVAQELLAALERHPAVQVTPLVLRTSWRMTHLRTPLFLARLVRAVPRLVRSNRMDVVLFSSLVTASIAPVLRRRLGAKGPSLVSIVHGRDVTLPVGIYQRLVPRVLGALDGVLAVSEATGRACLDRGLAPTKLHVVPNGVDPNRFSGVAESRVSPDSFLLLSVGRHVERKGFVWFLDQVMPRLPGDVQYVLAGEGPTTDAIHAAVARWGLRDRVHLVGKVSEGDLGALYRRADLFVMPNLPVAGDVEGFGLVLAEAAMCGLPAVAANLEGIRDVVRDGETGTLVPSGDAGAFADAIVRYRDPQLRATAGQRAVRHARDRFAWSVAVKRYVEALAEIRGGVSESPSALARSVRRAS